MLLRVAPTGDRKNGPCSLMCLGAMNGGHHLIFFGDTIGRCSKARPSGGKIKISQSKRAFHFAEKKSFHFVKNFNVDAVVRQGCVESFNGPKLRVEPMLREKSTNKISAGRNAKCQATPVNPSSWPHEAFQAAPYCQIDANAAHFHPFFCVLKM